MLERRLARNHRHVPGGRLDACGGLGARARLDAGGRLVTGLASLPPEPRHRGHHDHEPQDAERDEDLLLLGDEQQDSRNHQSEAEQDDEAARRAHIRPFTISRLMAGRLITLAG